MRSKAHRTPALVLSCPAAAFVFSAAAISAAAAFVFWVQLLQNERPATSWGDHWQTAGAPLGAVLAHRFGARSIPVLEHLGASYVESLELDAGTCRCGCRLVIHDAMYTISTRVRPGEAIVPGCEEHVNVHERQTPPALSLAWTNGTWPVYSLHVLVSYGDDDMQIWEGAFGHYGTPAWLKFVERMPVWQSLAYSYEPPEVKRPPDAIAVEVVD